MKLAIIFDQTVIVVALGCIERGQGIAGVPNHHKEYAEQSCKHLDGICACVDAQIWSCSVQRAMRRQDLRRAALCGTSHAALYFRTARGCVHMHPGV